MNLKQCTKCGMEYVGHACPRCKSLDYRVVGEI